MRLYTSDGRHAWFNLHGTSRPARASDLKSQGCGFESHCGQEYFILYFVAFVALLTGRLVPCEWNQAWRPTEVYRCIERIIIWKKTVAVPSLKECALALSLEQSLEQRKENDNTINKVINMICFVLMKILKIIYTNFMNSRNIFENDIDSYL